MVASANNRDAGKLSVAQMAQLRGPCPLCRAPVSMNECFAIDVATPGQELGLRSRAGFLESDAGEPAGRLLSTSTCSSDNCGVGEWGRGPDGRVGRGGATPAGERFDGGGGVGRAGIRAVGRRGHTYTARNRKTTSRPPISCICRSDDSTSSGAEPSPWSTSSAYRRIAMTNGMIDSCTHGVA